MYRSQVRLCASLHMACDEGAAAMHLPLHDRVVGWAARLSLGVAAGGERWEHGGGRAEAREEEGRRSTDVNAKDSQCGATRLRREPEISWTVIQ